MLIINRMKLIEAIAREGYTIRGLSREVGIQPRMISEMVNKPERRVRFSTLKKLWRALNISMGELILRDENLVNEEKAAEQKPTPTITPATDIPSIDLRGDIRYITCSEREFAKLVGISPSMAHKLKMMGVIETDIGGRKGRILLRQSLKEYMRCYLRPNKRIELETRLKEMGYGKILG